MNRLLFIVFLSSFLQACLPSERPEVSTGDESESVPFAYQAVGSQTLSGASIFFYPEDGVTEIGFREPGRFENLGSGDNITTCLLGRFDCYLYQGWPPIVGSAEAQVPVGYSISVRPSDLDQDCKVISVLSDDQRSTESTVCEGFGVVEFLFSRRSEIVERYVLKGRTGFFG